MRQEVEGAGGILLPQAGDKLRHQGGVNVYSSERGGLT